MALCKICNLRRPRRFCPGVGGDICSICCGTEREVTVECPFDCEYLIEARAHEKRLEHGDHPPNEDIRVSDRFLRENEMLVGTVGRAVLRAGLSVPGAVDSDVSEALEALIRTYRTLGSGLYYETRPDNPIAARISGLVQEQIAEYRRDQQERTGLSGVRDSAILAVLAFLQRAEILRRNGRKRSRSYLHFLWDHFPEPDEQPGDTPALIVP
jgi:hypothetical protein